MVLRLRIKDTYIFFIYIDPWWYLPTALKKIRHFNEIFKKETKLFTWCFLLEAIQNFDIRLWQNTRSFMFRLSKTSRRHSRVPMVKKGLRMVHAVHLIIHKKRKPIAKIPSGDVKIIMKINMTLHQLIKRLVTVFMLGRGCWELVGRLHTKWINDILLKEEEPFLTWF